MKQQQALILILALITGLPVHAATSADKEMQNYSKSMEGFAKEFPDKPDRSTARYNGGGGRSGASLNKFDSSYYNQASKTPYAKSEVMKTLSKLSDTLAKTAGSAMALDSAQKARQTAKALSGSSDPDFKEMGSQYEALASAIESGDRTKAETIARKIESIQRPYVSPNYKPTDRESAIVRALNTAAAGIVAALGGVLGGIVVNSILKALGFGSGFLSRESGTLGQKIGTTAVKGGSASSALESSGSRTISKGSSDLNKAINKAAPKEEKLPSSSAGQSGSAPSAQ